MVVKKVSYGVGMVYCGFGMIMAYFNSGFGMARLWLYYGCGMFWHGLGMITARFRYVCVLVSSHRKHATNILSHALSIPELR